MSKKGFFLILGLSVGIWFISILIQSYTEAFISGKVGYSFFGSSCYPTGYPFAKCVNEFENPFGLYLINIIFWFIVIWLIWKVIFKRVKR